MTVISRGTGRMHSGLMHRQGHIKIHFTATSTDQPEEGELDNFLRSHTTMALEQNRPTWSLTPLSSPRPTSKFSLPGLTSLLFHTLSALAPQCFEKFPLSGQRKVTSSPTTPLTLLRAASLPPSGLSHPICPMTQS